MATKEYSEKRDFDVTPEPSPNQKTQGRKNVFVVHRYDATRLHYDLRLRMGDVLCSWAVPKGFSYNPETRRLAVRTEDHPLEYFDFRGMIPKGEYGAGSVDVWDTGVFSMKMKETPGEALKKGELKIQLIGRRLQGEWHLILTDADKWLLFKARDVFAREEDYLDPPPIYVPLVISFLQRPAAL